MSRIFSTLFSIAAMFGILFAALAPAQAAVIYTFSQITGESSIIDNGDVLLTHGGSGTINGIGFSQTSNADGVTRSFSGFGTCGGDFSNQFSGGLNSILSSCHFQPGAGNVSLTFNGLNIGEDYSLQLLWSNTNNTTGRFGRVAIQGSAFDYNATPANNAYSLLAEFTALSTSEVITFGRGSASESLRFQLNGFVFSGTADPVPAPAAIALLGLGLLGLRMRRRTA